MEMKEVWKRETGYTIRNVAISANGEYIVVGSFDFKVYLFDRKGTLLWSYLTGDTVRDVAISSDGNLMAAGSYDHHVYFFNKDGDLLWRFKTGDPIRDISISGDGEYLVVGSNDTNVYFLNRQGTLLWKHRTKGSVITVSLSLKGEYISIGSSDRRIYFFNRAGDRLWSYETGSSVQDVELTIGGRYVAAGSFDKYLYFFDRAGNLLWKRTWGTPVRKVAISPRGETIAAAGEGEIELYNQNGNRLWHYTSGSHEVQGLEIAGQGGAILCGSRDDEVLYFDRAGRLLWKFPTPEWVETVAVGSRGRFITAGLRSGVLYLFDNIDFFRDHLEEARRSIVKMENFGTDATRARALYGKATTEFNKKNYLKSLALANGIRSFAEHTIRKTRPAISYSMTAESQLRNAVWTPIHFTIANTGTADAQDIMIKVNGPLRLRGERKIEDLKEDEIKDLTLGLRPNDPGDLSMELEISYFDLGGMQYSVNERKTLEVLDSSIPASDDGKEGKMQRITLFKKVAGKVRKDATMVRSNPKCPNCNRNILVEWIACPHCGDSLQ